jgi:hypothetical protein
MDLPEIDVLARPYTLAAGGRPWREALADESEKGVATVFQLDLDGDSEKAVQSNLDGWWGAPEHARRAGLICPTLPPEWKACWRRRYWRAHERRFLFVPFLHVPFFRGWIASGQVRVWPGATCTILLSPEGLSSPLGGPSRPRPLSRSGRLWRAGRGRAFWRQPC